MNVRDSGGEKGPRHAHRHNHRDRRWLVSLIVVAAAALGTVIAIDRVFFSGTTRACQVETESASVRPKLQRVLDGLVAGPAPLAPGATAYVSGPHGSWAGAAGVANTRTCALMRVDTRMRLESVSKIFTATLILQLAQAGRLRVTDTVARWLPGLLPYGRDVTIRELLTMTSGLIDNNDITNASTGEKRVDLARVKDAKLRTQLLAAAARVDENPAAVVPSRLWVRWAAWQPLLFTPGEGYHYSNIGYDILGMIATRAGGKPLPDLYRDWLFRPLRLHATAYDPQGPISGAHSHGYGITPGGAVVDATDWHWGVGADGGIVSNARDTATFLVKLMGGKLLARTELDAMEGEDLWQGGIASGCADQAFGWSGGGSGYKTEVWVNGDGTRVAVLLLNARHYDTAQPAADAAAHTALERLYCNA